MNANPSYDPCTADDHPPSLSSPPNWSLLDARTGLFDDHRTPTTDKEAVAHAKVANANLFLFVVGGIHLDLARSRTTATCDPFDTTPEGTSPGSFSTVVGLIINPGLPGGGTTYTTNDPVDIAVAGGTLHLNWVLTTATETTRRAIFLDLPGESMDAVFAESRSGCPEPPG